MSEELGTHSTHSSAQRKSVRFKCHQSPSKDFFQNPTIIQALQLSMSTSPNFLAVSHSSHSKSLFSAYTASLQTLQVSNNPLALCVSHIMEVRMLLEI